MVGLVNALNDVFFIDAQTGWAVGEMGTILHTEDGGETWQRQICPLNSKYFPLPDLRRVIFTDSQTGWIIGLVDWSMVGLFHTDNAGETWTLWPIPYTDKEWLSFNMSWANKETGWLIVGSRVYQTADGGHNWSRRKLPFDTSGSVTISGTTMRDVLSIDSQHVWILADNWLFRSIDGGETWAMHPIDFYYPQAFTFVNEQIGWIAGNGKIARTTDGGATWQVQYDNEQYFGMQAIEFLDAETGWVIDGNQFRWFEWTGSNIPNDQLLHTTDGGKSWQITELPAGRRALEFFDTSRGWAVGEIDPRDATRTTLARTQDGAKSWQILDTAIAASPLFYPSTARINSYLSQEDPKSSSLMARLIPGPCTYEEQTLIRPSLLCQGWDGVNWQDSPLSDECENWTVSQRLEADLDLDGQNEIFIGGNGEFGEVLAGILDWDGMQWQTAWFGRQSTSHWGGISAQIQDTELHPQLLLASYTRPGSGTGIDTAAWDILIIECEHLNCKPIWIHRLSELELEMVRAWKISYNWLGGQYRFVETSPSRRPAIQVQRYGMSFEQIPETEDAPLPTSLEVQISPIVQTTYHWDGTQYTPTNEIELKPGYELDTTPITETIDLDGDGAQDQVTHRWEVTFNGLEQVSSFYQSEGQELRLTQVFTTFVSGALVDPISIVDQGGKKVIVQCAPPDQVYPQEGEWPSFEPVCTTYYWDAARQQFVPQTESK